MNAPPAHPPTGSCPGAPLPPSSLISQEPTRLKQRSYTFSARIAGHAERVLRGKADSSPSSDSPACQQLAPCDPARIHHDPEDKRASWKHRNCSVQAVDEHEHRQPRDLGNVVEQQALYPGGGPAADTSPNVRDRRPLAPAAVAKMVVRREDDSIVDEDDIDCSFFLVTADLWSSDGKREMNLVLHPTSSDRYITTHTPKRRRANPTAPQSLTFGAQHGPPDPAASPGASRHAMRQSSGDIHSAGMTPLTAPVGYGSQQGYPFPPQASTLIQDQMTYQPVASYNPLPDSTGWAYGMQPSSPSTYPTIPSISRTLATGAAGSMNQSTTPSVTATDPWPQPVPPPPEEPENNPYRTWSADPQYGTLDPLQPAPVPIASSSSSVLESPMRATTQYPTCRAARKHGMAASRATTPRAIRRHRRAISAVHRQLAHRCRGTPQPPIRPIDTYAQSAPNPASTIPPLPQHTYTRTLVGPLSANACRLQDEHRKPGVFFLFQDLSIRTEGTFRLRLRLMNIGAPPAPESGALSVHTGVSPVLAQTFTAPFDVFSAKRFPGVPDTTALSIAFGNQGQKLPLRNRHGTSKQGVRRRRDDSEGGSDDSDGA
ncbi:hypothetical protein EVG20_g7890 [Dentipellis fragilis]|uniref:Velvet domain-containing protein n=1 Tax=Dentipellis fragilis TaxID=205917 RepID=A0A4Y9Y9G5_9AGAM|nr:hypothetical protein EVG20_g7890 [Dentipellis fragilis]